LSPLSDPVRVYRNRAAHAGHWLEVLPVGSGDGRTPLHAKVRVEFSGREALQEFTIQPSYASGSWLPLHFGLGSASRVDRLSVTWPEGDASSYEVPAVDRAYRVLRKDGLMPGLAGTK